MSKTHYSEIAERYIGLAIQYPDFDNIEVEASSQLWQHAATVLQALPFGERCKVRELLERKRGAGSYIRNRPEDYRLMDGVYKAFAQRAGLI